ncbi:ActS/PrrB/RegB family redox-sensitive histidine kinase [Phenylobacterium sp.]|uniref:ActS/PrrB/RegB family redox-sensitive histidine kinase n=1 Tax=Phenylobacterium sp. TaxID=1871053 RepID=UPI003D2A7D03
MADAVAPHASMPAGLDTAGSDDAQDVWDSADIRRGHLRLRTLVRLRWVVVAGEVALLLLMAFGLGFDAPYLACAVVVVIGAIINVVTAIAAQPQRVMGDREAVLQLSLDIVQMSALLALVGGTANPFVLILLAPPTLAAATLPLRPVWVLGVMASVASLLLAVVNLPYPSLGETTVSLEFRLVSGLANVAGIALIASYVRQSVEEAARMALALDVTQKVLAREQRLSALGALAAAAAHELGTPLATISIVSKEMAREAVNPQVKEDAELLMSQADRCREILQRLAATPDKATDAVHERLSLRQLVQEVIEPHANASKEVRVEAIVTGAKDVKTPDIRRLPEITHAFTTFVENAVDFARSEILVSARFDADSISIEVRDDGPGFAPEILAKLGEPYVTSRPGAEGSRTGHIGMGLGFFISKTLLERTGAVVTFHNARPRGAVVAARWPRSLVEAV